MRYSFTLLFLLTSICGFSQFQKSRNIFRMGLRNTTIQGTSMIQGNMQVKPVFDCGYGHNYPISNKVSFQPEIHYSVRGFAKKLPHSDSTYYKTTTGIHYLDFSPNFSLTIGPSGVGRNPLHIWGGPYIGYGLWGGFHTKGQYLNQETGLADSTVTTSESAFNKVKRLDFGINAGIGIQFDRFTHFGITCSQGLVDISKNSSSQPWKTFTLGFYLTFIFDDMF
ncbi:porin family protein [Flectobacillus major]|uniref:porin family protein n=1 Tax=Flectobacillus major TaxID=103 RepID=UPI0004031DB7|nr:porin family protein [Flectobacillus major]